MLYEEANRLNSAMTISTHTGEILGSLRIKLDHIQTNMAARGMRTEIEDAVDYIKRAL